MSLLAVASPQLIIRGLENATPASEPIPFWIWVAAVTALLSTMAAIWFWWSLRRTSDQRELAFKALSRRLRISGRDQRALRVHAKDLGVHPVALLLCSSER